MFPAALLHSGRTQTVLASFAFIPTRGLRLPTGRVRASAAPSSYDQTRSMPSDEPVAMSSSTGEWCIAVMSEQCPSIVRSSTPEWQRSARMEGG